MTDVVIFEEIACQNGKLIGVATLNSPKSLNALSGEMIDVLFPKLKDWQQRTDIAMVLLQAGIEKAFCAGGDIVKLYNEMVTHPNEYAPEIESYFAREYQLDYLIHTFGKPFMVWGTGIVMGGGLGMMVGASHRIVTETSRIAMPEISIGLYPDVGGTHFLNKMPENCGLFLGLTGASINAADAKYANLADHFVHAEQKEKLIASLSQINWGETIALNHDKLTDAIRTFERLSLPSLPISQLKLHKETIDKVTKGDSLAIIVNDILAEQLDDKWFSKAQKSLKHGSALSAAIVYQQLQIAESLSLADCFKMELNLSVKCGKFGEFCEGVRALLIDKDNTPNWRYPSIAQVDPEVIEWFFESKWQQAQHPLAALGN